VIGVQTFIFWSKTPGPLDRKNIPQETYTPTTIPGCLLQPARVAAQGTNIDYAEATSQLISHPFPAALAAKSADLVQDQLAGTVYRVIGTIVYPAPNGIPHHVVLYLVLPTGLDPKLVAPGTSIIEGGQDTE